MTEQVEISVFNDKSYVRVKDYLKLKEGNEQLKQQIEQMKRCGNCKYVILDWDSYYCHYFSPPRFLCGDADSMVACKHWELEPFEDEIFCAKCKNYVNNHGKCKHSYSTCRNMSMYEEE